MQLLFILSEVEFQSCLRKKFKALDFIYKIDRVGSRRRSRILWQKQECVLDVKGQLLPVETGMAKGVAISHLLNKERV
jgi:hypothetical protein